MKYFKILVAIIATFIITLPSTAQELQTCVTTSRNPWEWPAHSNWFVSKKDGAHNEAWMMDFNTMNFNGTIQGPSANNQRWINQYEGITAASNDKGELIYLTTGRVAWDKNGTPIATDLNEGNEGGSTGLRGSASQGIIGVRHPLDPYRYYAVTVGDVINGVEETGYVAINVNKNTGAVSSEPFVGLGLTNTEAITATLHQNGVDIWILTHQYGGTDIYAILLKCDGTFETPIISSIGPNVVGDQARGGMAVSYDGKQVAMNYAGSGPDVHRQVMLYDFDNKTGILSDRKDIVPHGQGVGGYNVLFSKDNQMLFVSGYAGFGDGIKSFDISSGNEATIRTTMKGGFSTYAGANTGLGPAEFRAIQWGPDGKMYLNGLGGLYTWNGPGNSAVKLTGNVGTNNAQGLPNQYMPPAEEPDIEEVGPFCDTSSAVDLHTYWVCSGVSSEDTLEQRHDYFLLDGSDNIAGNSGAVVGQKTGIFDPVVAGVGTHKIVFEYCNVNDTIEIIVQKCPACKAKLQDVEPRICAGNDIRLDTMIIQGTQTRTWTIDSAPVPTPLAALAIGGGDTIFDALNTNIKTGTYKLKMQAEWNGDFCYDTMYITVDSLPIPVLEDSTICSDWSAVTLNPGAYNDYAWLPGGETTPTIDVTVADDYSVTVIDANGCQGDTMMTLTVNDLPIALLPNDTSICDGDPAITFSATGSTGGSGSAITSYTWEDGDNSDSKTTDLDGEYWVAVEDANGCHDTDSVVLTVHALPVVDLRNDTSICEGDAALTIEPLNPQANDSIYTWYSGEIANSIDRDTAGTYKVVLTDKNGCLDSAEFTLTINNLPTIDLRDSTICSDAPNVVWDAEAATPGMIVYQWANLSDLSPAGAGAILDTKTAGEYIIGVVDANQCIGADTIELIVNNFVPVDIGPDTAICADAADVVLDAGIANCNWYLWTPDNGTPTDQQTYSVNTQAMYRVQLEDQNGCSGEDSIYVTVNALPVVDLGPDSAICVGDAAVVFDAGNPGVGMQYLWGPGAEATQTISVTDANDYTVRIEDVNGCSDSDTVVLTVHALPTPDLGPDQNICQAEDSVIFDAGYPTAQSWVWDHGPATQVIKAHFDPAVTGTSTETYTVTVTDVNGCVKDTFATLTVNPMPIVSIRDSAVCMDAPDVVFDIGASFQTIAWSNGGSAEQESHSAAGIYSVEFTTASGCVGTDTFELVRNPLPTPDLGLDQTICADAAAVTFDAGAYASYAWSPNGETSQTITTDVAGTYELEVTDANGCKETTDVELIVIPMPTPDVIADYTKCPGANHTFDVAPYDDGFGPFTYAWHDGTTTSADYSTTAAEAVWVDITNVHGCTARDEGSVVDNPSLIVDIAATPDIHLCDGETTTLVPNFKAANGYFFTWSNTGTGTSETITVSDAGVYDLHVDNGGGCEGDGSIEIFVHPYPVLVPSVAGICDGDPAVIGGDNNLGGTFTYAWNTTETTPTISVTTAGTYTQTVTSDRGCVSTETVAVDVYPNPVPDLGTDIEVCDGVPVLFQDQSGTPNLTFAWSNGSTDPTISPTTGGTYSVTVTTPENCVGSDDVNLSFIPIPTIDAGADINLCEGESATIDPIVSSPGLTVSWNSGEVTEDITVNQTFNHIVQISDNGCTTSDTVAVNVVPLPTSTLDQSLAAEPFCFDEDPRGIAIDAGGNPAYDYLWSTGETTSNLTVNVEGTYIVNISVGNCSITDNIQFTAYCPSTIYVPNAFTPDGDGINDSFNAQGSNLEDFELYVYNRWGQLIYKSNSLFVDWDGTYMGNECQIDVYVWKVYYSVESTDGSGHRIKEQMTGRVSLMR